MALRFNVIAEMQGELTAANMNKLMVLQLTVIAEMEEIVC